MTLKQKTKGAKKNPLGTRECPLSARSHRTALKFQLLQYKKRIPTAHSCNFLNQLPKTQNRLSTSNLYHFQPQTDSPILRLTPTPFQSHFNPTPNILGSAMEFLSQILALIVFIVASCYLTKMVWRFVGAVMKFVGKCLCLLIKVMGTIFILFVLFGLLAAAAVVLALVA